jgi:cob(I)alamin adenosyltransferase
MVGGEFKVVDRKIVSVDTRELRSRVAESLAKLSAATHDARTLAGRLEPHVVAFAQSKAQEPLPIERRIPLEAR